MIAVRKICAPAFGGEYGISEYKIQTYEPTDTQIHKP